MNNFVLQQVRQSPVFLGRRKRELTSGRHNSGEGDMLDTVSSRFGNWSNQFTVVKQVDADVFFEDY